MSSIGKHGITATIPENILLGSGTFIKGLKYDKQSKAWTGDILGATNGGASLNIVGELLHLEVDGALVNVKGLTVKQGGKATMEINLAEVTTDIMQTATLFKKGTSDVEGYDLLVDKPQIDAGDYVENFGFVGLTANDKKEIVIIFDYALCTSGLTLDPKNKGQVVPKITMEAYADNAGNLDTLPVRIYYPPATTEVVATSEAE